MMKVDTVLFDLDNTLLGNSMSAFVPRYFALLSDYATQQFADRQLFLQELMLGTRAMMMREPGQLSNRELFWRSFEERTGESAQALEPFFDQFYESQFVKLRDVCVRRPVAEAFVRSCFEHGLKVVIATNPLLPRRAVEHRLEWAGLPVTEYDFALVTTYDNMHSSKPDTGYYREILERVQSDASSAVMIGDDWINDIVPAAQLGLTTYWIAEPRQEPPQPDLVAGYGTLEDSYSWLFEAMGRGQ